MRQLSIFFFSLFSGLCSCEINQRVDPAINEPENLNEVRTLLKDQLFTPTGKLRSRDQYQSDENGLHFRSDFYYSQSGDIALTIGIYEGGDSGGIFGFSEGDTTGATTYHYTADRLTEEKSFNLKNGEFTLSGALTYSYTDSGKLFQILNDKKEPITTHYYNEKGLLTSKKYGKNQDMEVDEFSYNDQDQVILHVQSSLGTPLFEHYFRYDSKGRLVAKETWSMPNDKENVFQYFYNDQDQLIKELEFYPQWGFTQRFKRIYSYY
ncbi:hypothetical protein J0A67_20560 [Algoriphagus aestuariicola]|uniref:YD repeat-containing protein n=1 Tax=Algoriphagus aestuariicola TaxID=1852016 RepID=A0ABS3BY73_9BACT|nr:hypothetical protein [Algoriphagus aestuariicola]MBN7803280.1 hypothetical protein [Algoriphagus aestuariicola]